MVEGLKGEKLFLTNSFKGLKKDIENIRDNYDCVYMFGIDATLKNQIRNEKCADLNNNVIFTEIELSELAIRLD